MNTQKKCFLLGTFYASWGFVFLLICVFFVISVYPGMYLTFGCWSNFSGNKEIDKRIIDNNSNDRFKKNALKKIMKIWRKKRITFLSIICKIKNLHYIFWKIITLAPASYGDPGLGWNFNPGWNQGVILVSTQLKPKYFRTRHIFFLGGGGGAISKLSLFFYLLLDL